MKVGDIWINRMTGDQSEILCVGKTHVFWREENGVEGSCEIEKFQSYLRPKPVKHEVQVFQDDRGEFYTRMKPIIGTPLIPPTFKLVKTIKFEV